MSSTVSNGAQDAAHTTIAGQGGRVDWLTTADGKRVRTAYFPLEGARAHVLLLNGRTEFIEKYLETIAALHDRGFAVWTLDWRGQGGSDRLVGDAQLGWVRDFDDFVADLGRFFTESVLPGAAGAPLVLMAHSMGGNIGLRFLAEHQRYFERAVFSAPMVAFLVGNLTPFKARMVAGAMCLLGRGQAYAKNQGPAVSPLVFDNNLLTSSPERFARLNRLLEADPKLRLGGVTWGWLRAALRSSQVTDDVRFAERITIPALVLMAQDDRIVDNAAIRRFAEALPAGRLVEIPDARHELLCERNELRDQVWQEIDQFLGGISSASAV